MNLENKLTKKVVKDMTNVHSVLDLIDDAFKCAKILSLEERKLYRDSIFGYLTNEFKSALKTIEEYKQYREGLRLKQRLVISYGKLINLF